MSNVGQCFQCGGWHTNPYSCPNTLGNQGASEPLRDWRDAEIERLRSSLEYMNREYERRGLCLDDMTLRKLDAEKRLAEATTLLREADPSEHCATSCDYCSGVSKRIAAFLAADKSGEAGK